LPEIKNLTYENRLKHLYLSTLKHRMTRHDMTEVYKITIIIDALARTWRASAVK